MMTKVLSFNFVIKTYSILSIQNFIENGQKIFWYTANFFTSCLLASPPPPPQSWDFQKRPVHVGLNQKDYFSLHYPLVYREDLYVILWQTKKTTQSLNKRLAPNELKVLTAIVISSSTQESLVLNPDWALFVIVFSIVNSNTALKKLFKTFAAYS